MSRAVPAPQTMIIIPNAIRTKASIIPKSLSFIIKSKFLSEKYITPTNISLKA